MRILIFLLLFIFPLGAAITLDNHAQQYDDFPVAYYYDQSGQMDIKAASQTPFSDSINNRFTLGYLEGVTWFKFTIENRSPSEAYVLQLNEAIWKEVDLYEPVDGQWMIHRNGLDIPLAKRNIQDPMPTFHLSIKQGETKTYYLCARTIASQLGKFTLYQKEYYGNQARFNLTTLYLIFIFALLTIASINIYSFFLTRDRTYLLYIAYTITFALFASMQSGTYLLLGLPGWNAGLHFTGALVVIFLLLFSDRFLNLEENVPRIHRFFQFSLVVFILFSLLILFNVDYITMVFNFYSILFFTALFSAAIIALKKGLTSARYYLIALIIYTPLMGFMIMTFNSMIEYTVIGRHIFLLGAYIEILFFTLILANRYRNIEQERLRVQSELLEVKKSNEYHLEEQINLRTEELRSTNEALVDKTKELEATQKKLQTMVITDSLTQIYNRSKMEELLIQEQKRAARYGECFSIIMIDIDYFKQINDTHGHQTGDLVLIAFAKILAQTVREVDEVARWGGEEFMILCPNTNLDGAAVLAREIRANVESHHFAGLAKVTASLGVAECSSAEQFETVIRHADEALYRAKNRGRNTIDLYGDAPSVH